MLQQSLEGRIKFTYVIPFSLKLYFFFCIINSITILFNEQNVLIYFLSLLASKILPQLEFELVILMLFSQKRLINNKKTLNYHIFLLLPCRIGGAHQDIQLLPFN